MDASATDPAAALPVRPPAPARVPWRHSLRTRLMLWSMLTSTVLLVLVAALFYAAIRVAMIENAEDEVRSLAAQTSRSLAATMDSVQVSGRTLAASASGVGREPFNLRSLLMAVLLADPDIAGAMLIIEPGKLAADDPGFTWYIRRDGAGYAESSVEGLGYDDYRRMPWYVRTATTRAPWWSEPYANAATANRWFTTYNLPLRRPGDRDDAPAIGMVSVDVPVDRLRTIIQRDAGRAGMESWLVSPEGRLVAHPDPALALKASVAELVARHGRADLVPIADALARRMPAELVHDAPVGGRRFSVATPVGHGGWGHVLSVSESRILANLGRATLLVVLGGLLGVVLSVWAIRHYSRAIARPIEDLTDSAGHFAAGEFEYPLGHVARSDEVGVMARAFDNARGSIKRQIHEIAQMSAARQRLESELSIARDIQLAMLPPGRALAVDGARLDAQAQLEPAKAVGGDFYTFFERPAGTLWFVIGDVSDKGVPAALFMARAVTVLETAARLRGAPDAALVEASQRLVEGNDTCMFATVLCGVVDVATGELVMASAGHEPPVRLHADGRRELLPVESGPPLGFEPIAAFDCWRGRLEPGDALLAYTDGITEAFDAGNRAFGVERLLAALDPGDDAQALCARLVAAVHRFADGAPQSDDITVLALRRTGG
ncbi:SpoIIE family protein phosphatase [Cognatilysobacter tabacisoli]|uniref:SpoIIE family protein phosphatase n=1 Tax=Cognatilysobacter tabacisoli TaxID=2315424 RepID=UPI001E30A831|nr:SpoIIE family protein phosphatase [Lysobacter tabacisoli]